MESQAGGKEAEEFGLYPEDQGESLRSFEKENDVVRDMCSEKRNPLACREEEELMGVDREAGGWAQSPGALKCSD